MKNYNKNKIVEHGIWAKEFCVLGSSLAVDLWPAYEVEPRAIGCLGKNNYEYQVIQLTFKNITLSSTHIFVSKIIYNQCRNTDKL